MNRLSPPTAPPEPDDRLGFRARPMEPWYNPSQLARTALRTLVSSLFGAYADKREMQACLNESKPYEQLADRKEVWIDYISDLGSGFNSTYSLAYLLGAAKLPVDGHDTSRGDLLIMGGDEVYPTPSWQQYTDRLIGPYRSARSYIPEPAPRLFAIPGNHDWYDGLTSFLKVFCQQRWIGGWKTEQTRSYFAIQLPYGWWLWGIDIQLSEDIDLPQQQFFERVNRNYTRPGDKVILCTAEPAWVYQAYKDRDKSFRNLEWFCENYITEPDVDAPPRKAGDGPLKKLTLPVTLTGDMHHYSSYFCPSADPDQPREWKITVGGGGAFMHPTHHLPVQFNEDEGLLYGQRKPKAYQSNAFYPDQAQSRRLVLGNLLFLFKNPWFASLMGIVCFLFAWLVANAEFFKAVLAYPPAWSSVGPVFYAYLTGLIRHPFLILYVLIVGAGFVSFADCSHKRYRWASYLGGGLHAVAQLFVLLTTCWLISYASSNLLVSEWQRLLWQSAGLFLAGGGLGGVMMGVYLLVANGVFGIHETEAFSSLRIEDYKSFMRLHLTKDRLTLYPVKVERVARQWDYQAQATNGDPWFEPLKTLHAELIEPPILIKNQ